MPFKVQVGPPQISIHQGQTVLISELDGQINSRWSSGGTHEDLDVTNNSMNPIKFQLEIAIRSDFADIFEVKSNRIVRRGRIATEWSPAQQRLRTTYRNRVFIRGVPFFPLAP